jgi:hypothetical protein
LVDRQVLESLAKLKTKQLLRQSACNADAQIEVLDFEEDERKRFFGEVMKCSLGDPAVKVAGFWEWAMCSSGFTAVETMLPFLAEGLILHEQLAVGICFRGRARLPKLTWSLWASPVIRQA